MSGAAWWSSSESCAWRAGIPRPATLASVPRVARFRRAGCLMPIAESLRAWLLEQPCSFCATPQFCSHPPEGSVGRGNHEFGSQGRIA
jgi:hypothetical protein